MNARSLRLWLPLSCLALGCGGEDHDSRVDVVDVVDDAQADADADDTDTVAPITIEPLGDAAGSLALTVGDDRALVLSRDGDALLTWPVDAIAVGLVDAIDDALNYDPYYLEEGVPLASLYTPPDGLVWRTTTAITDASVDGSDVSLTYALEGGGAVDLTLTHAAEGRFRARWTARDTPGEPAFARVRVLADADEGFYGLGEQLDHVDRRGTVTAMQLEPTELDSGFNQAHVPVPLLVGTRGWGLFVDSYRPGVFAVATDDPRTITVTYGLGPAHADGLELWLFTAPHPLDVTRHYYEVTGYPGPVARWALGPWIWRDEVDDQAAVVADLVTIRDLDLATTGYWIDRPYASDVNSFDFDPARYPDPGAVFGVADDLGLAIALWHAPYLDPDGAISADVHDEARDAGYFPPTTGGALSPWGPPIDFTDEGAVDWWQAQLAGYLALGARGFKLDYGEDVLVGAFGVRTPWRFSDGRDELTMHRAYQLDYHRAYAELLPEDGGFLLTRAGAHRDQVHGPIIWPGDLDASMRRVGDEGVDADGAPFLSVGGLPAAVVAGSSLGVSGFPLFASDTGGSRHAPPSRETYVRWFQHTALSPVMQVGTNTNDLPWAFGPDHERDEELLGWYRDYARLHLRLWPYLWTHWRRVAEHGRPIQRPLGLAHPELSRHPDAVYLLGDDLLVAPVVEEGARARAVPLPSGVWRNWWTGRRHAGPSTPAIDAPLDRIPLLVREGATIPMLRPTVDTLLPASGDVDSYADAPGPLWVRTTPGGAGGFTLFDGTVVRQEATGVSRVALGREAGDELGGAVVFELFGLEGAPTAVTGDGEPLDEAADLEALDAVDAGWTYAPDLARGTLWVKLSAEIGEASVERE